MPTDAQELEYVKSSEIFKISLGEAGEFEEEAFTANVAMLETEANFYDAVKSGIDEDIIAAGKKIKTKHHPRGNADIQAIRNWQNNITNLEGMPDKALLIHWQSHASKLWWAIAGPRSWEHQRYSDERGYQGVIIYRELWRPWSDKNLENVLLNRLHPKIRDVSINRTVCMRVKTHTDYIRALIANAPTSQWEQQSDWLERAQQEHWQAKPRDEIASVRNADKAQTTMASEIIHDLLEADAQRMSYTAFQTTQYATGQKVPRTVKEKQFHFSSRYEAERFVLELLRKQENKCAITQTPLTPRGHGNRYLAPSLDRIDSNGHYSPGNLQVVTRAMNEFKSASDAAELNEKLEALREIAKYL